MDFDNQSIYQLLEACCNNHHWYEWFANVIIPSISLLFVWLGYSTAKKEYENHKDVKMANALSEYNQRYISSEYIINVITFLEKEVEYVNKIEKYSKYIFNIITSIDNCYDISKSHIFIGSINQIEQSKERYSTRGAINAAVNLLSNTNKFVNKDVLCNESLVLLTNSLKGTIAERKSKTNTDYEVSTYDKDMFMRFFEELEYAIQKKVMNEKEVYDIFSFYALKVYDLNVEFVDDFDKPYWSLFKSFCKRMKKCPRKYYSK